MNSPSSPAAGATHAEPEGLWPLLQLDDVDHDHYRAPNIARNLAGAIFGGQFLGSAMAAAIASTPNQRPHMLQAFFLRSGSAAKPLDIEVERSKDGRRFAHRRVLLRQPGKLLLSAEVSFHDDEPSPEHQRTTLPDVPAPETLADLVELAARYREQIQVERYRRLLGRPSMQVRPCDPAGGLIARIPAARFSFWMRPAGALPATRAAQAAALAFMSDHWLASPSTAPHTECLFEGPYQLSSLNHSLWLHREPDLSDWLLYEVESPILRGARGFARGSIYTRSGELVASVAQEALLQKSNQD